jgi:thymidylate synthase ThyX
MLSIPSSFIFQVNLAEFCHIYKLRNKNTSAHPEVRELCERIADLIEEDSNGHFNRDFFMEVEN